eukprot:scaffold56439_cov47-Phaeocystis_antarctica.AAC.3
MHCTISWPSGPGCVTNERTSSWLGQGQTRVRVRVRVGVRVRVRVRFTLTATSGMHLLRWAREHRRHEGAPLGRGGRLGHGYVHRLRPWHGLRPAGRRLLLVRHRPAP